MFSLLRMVCLVYKMSKIVFLGIYFHDVLQKNTGGYKGLQGLTKGYSGLQGVTRGYRGLPRILETFDKQKR